MELQVGHDWLPCAPEPPVSGMRGVELPGAALAARFLPRAVRIRSESPHQVLTSCLRGFTMNWLRSAACAWVLTCAVTTTSAQSLVSARPETVGMSSQRLERLTQGMKALFEKG